MYYLSGELTVILIIVWWFEKLQRCKDIQYREVLSQESKRMVSDSNPRQIGSFVELTASETLGHKRENIRILAEKGLRLLQT
jgi:hypothetical protein